LRVVLSKYLVAEPMVYLVYVSRRHLPLKIRTFVDFFVEFAAKIPQPRPTA
jgi:DNA-binding transcriptional LysR family regulator